MGLERPLGGHLGADKSRRSTYFFPPKGLLDALSVIQQPRVALRRISTLRGLCSFEYHRQMAGDAEVG
jgi:hypothetical protein